MSKTTKLRNFFQIHYASGRTGVPFMAVAFMKKNPKYTRYISGLDHKYAHRQMRKQGFI